MLILNGKEFPLRYCNYLKFEKVPGKEPILTLEYYPPETQGKETVVVNVEKTSADAGRHGKGCWPRINR